MALARTLGLRAATLLGVLLTVLVLLVVMLGSTGFSDRILTAVINEEIRGLRTAQATQSRDPDALEGGAAGPSGGAHRLLRPGQGVVGAGCPPPSSASSPWTSATPAPSAAPTAVAASPTSSWSGCPTPALLLTTSLIITAVIGLAVGVKMATRVGTRLDRFVTFGAAISFALPAWWTGILLILLLSFQFNILPSGGMFSTPPPVGGIARFFDVLKHAILPIITLVLVSVGPYLYAVRTMTLNVAQEDHVLVARAKGLAESAVMRQHILRVAAPPIVTGLILSLVGSLGGSILVETVFNWNGMGRLYFEAVAGTPDEGLIVALTFIFTLMYVVARFVLEVLYLLLDPRVRYGA